MTDEKFEFIADTREKKSVAHSSRKRRTHNGKGGAVRFPSDFLSRKELNEMNGDCKSYRLNSPMKWAEFKAMPDDLKITYVKLLRQKYNVPDRYIGDMLGVGQNTISSCIVRLGIGLGKGKNPKKWDKEGFMSWCNGAPALAPVCSDDYVEHSFVEDVEKVVEFLDDPEPAELPEPPAKSVVQPNTVPCSGNLTFTGSAKAALEAVAVLLGGANVRISVSWELCPEEGAFDNG